MGMNSTAPARYGAPPPMGAPRPGTPPPPGPPMTAGLVGMPQPGGVPPPPSGVPPQPMGSTGWNPQPSGPMVGGPQAGQMPQAPISPEGFNAYRRLQTMPVTGAGKGAKNAYNQAAMQFRGQYGGYDPNGMMQRTKALRRYGG